MQKFNQLPEAVRERVDNPAADEVIKEIEDRYQISLKLLIVLVMVGEIEFDDIPDYLYHQYHLDEEVAADIRDELVKKIFVMFLDEQDRQVAKPAEAVKNIFKRNLVAFLKATEDNRHDINERIIYMMETDETINEEELVKQILANSEELTTKPFLINGQEAAPSIANWLQDFIKYQGFDDFDNFRIVEYVSSSPNAKILDKDEKQILMDLIQLYRNIKFFPTPQEGDPRDWEVFPLAKEEKEFKALSIPGGLENVSSSTPAGQVLSWQEKLKKINEKNEPFLSRLKNLADMTQAQTKGDLPSIIMTLLNDFEAKRQEPFLAGLFLLVKMEAWPAVMQDENIKNLLIKTVLPLLKKQKADINLERIIADFEQSSNSGLYGKILLKYFLNVIMPAQLQTSAYLASQLENIFAASGQKEYLGLAYFNLLSEEYEWANVDFTADGFLKME